MTGQAGDLRKQRDIARRAGKPGRQRLIGSERRAGRVRGVETVVVLVAVATVVAAFAGRLRVPAPSLLVAAGLVAGLLPGAPQVDVPPSVVSLVVLPPLLYAASEELPWRDVRAVWRPVVVLAVGLVLASAAAVAAVAGAVASLSASMAFVLGAVLASTDPVAVGALARRISLPARVQALVQAESLFNDGTSLVLFQIAVALATGATARTAAAAVLLHGAGEFVLLAGGGALAGAVVAAGAVVLRRRVTDPVLETVAALLTPYVAYLLGEVLHVSGVTAVIVAGLVIGSKRTEITTAQTRLQAALGVPGRHLRAGKRGLQPDRPGTPHAGPRAGSQRRVAGGGAGRDRDPHRHPGGVGLRDVSHIRPARRHPPGLARGRRGVVGRHPRRGAAGRRLVDPPDHGQRGPVAAAGSGPGAGRRHDRGLAASCRASPWSRWPGWPGSAGPDPRAPSTRRPSPGCGWPRPGWPAWRSWPRTTPPPTR